MTMQTKMCPICGAEMRQDGQYETWQCFGDNCLTVWLSNGDILRLQAALAAARADALEQCERLAGNINPASNKERVNGIPGGDAMGAIIEYRDKIRALATATEAGKEDKV